MAVFAGAKDRFGRVAEVTMQCPISRLYLRYLTDEVLAGRDDSNTLDRHRRF